MSSSITMDLSLGSGTCDTDRCILYLMDDYDAMFSLLCSNKHWNSIPNNIFWHQKFIKTFGCTMKKERNINYQQLYRQLIRMSLTEQLLHASCYGYDELFTLDRMNLFLSHNDHPKISVRYYTIITMAQNAYKNGYSAIATFLTNNNFINANGRYLLGHFMRMYIKDK